MRGCGCPGGYPLIFRFFPDIACQDWLCLAAENPHPRRPATEHGRVMRCLSQKTMQGIITRIFTPHLSVFCEYYVRPAIQFTGFD